jgi:hypothetical protein
MCTVALINVISKVVISKVFTCIVRCLSTLSVPRDGDNFDHDILP